ncbi:MAG TPA: menaquinone biosynthesis protein [Pirellulaceae bacterium]|nr:menaquinone biosynthesis protein [Pirellulaceae bacterium]
MRIGAVSYLNTKPLVFGLAELAPQHELVFDLPSKLADRLAAAELDVALIPSIEFFQNPDYTIVSDACIGCRGPVLSVKLLSRVPLSQIRTLALDEGSRTSIALARILLWERYGIEPAQVPLPIDARYEQSPADAVLVIGDRAIHPARGNWVAQWDLGDEWNRWSELPFVFAMWVGHVGQVSRLPELAAALAAARDAGVTNLEQIAREEAGEVGLTYEQTLTYLRDNLHFYLGPGERAGLSLFYEQACKLGLASGDLALSRSLTGSGISSLAAQDPESVRFRLRTS